MSVHLSGGILPNLTKLISVQVHREQIPSSIDSELQSVIEALGYSVQLCALSGISKEVLAPRSVVLSTIEANKPLLHIMDDCSKDKLKTITDSASAIVWITRGNFLRGSRPDFALVQGLSRALMVEQPWLRFCVLDIEDASHDLGVIAQHASKVLRQLIDETHPEYEFSLNKGVSHTARWEPDSKLNSRFELRLSRSCVDTSLSAAGHAELSIVQPGLLDTIEFVKKDYKEELRPDQVELQVKSVGINAKVSFSLRVHPNECVC